MKRKNVLIILLTALLFLSGGLLGVANVYRIDAVCVEASLVSQTAQTEVDDLQARLQEAYNSESAFFVNRELADEIVALFPYFRITNFEKAYPNRLVVRIAEDEEIYAVATDETESAYYILNGEGTVLGVREDYKNRADGYENLLIKGLVATGEKGEPLVGDEMVSVLFPLCGEFSSRLSGIRRNVVAIEVFRPVSDATETAFIFTMREGVKLYLSNPAELGTEKMERAFNEYMGISSAQRLTGMIVVSDGADGILAEYFQNEWQISR